jgi:predicted hydrolase (HD superfamily)
MISAPTFRPAQEWAMDRNAAWELLCEYTQTDGLRKHGLAVEAVMRHFARKHGEDEDVWGITGVAP